MKQVTYEYDWTNILPAVVNYNLIEDGFWRVELVMESMTGVISPSVEGQIQATLPGIQHRVVGFRLHSADGYGSMTFRVKDGVVKYADDSSERGHETGGGSPREDSEPSRIVHPPPLASGF